MSNDLIALDNSIVTSAYNLTLNEQRLIYCALKQMPKYNPENPSREPINPKTPFFITREDFIELGADPSNVAQEIRQATRDLMKKSLYINTPIGVKEFHWLSEVLRYDRNAEKKLRERYPNPEDYNSYINALRAYNLIDALPTHKPDDNIVARVIFSPEIMPLLSELKASFTQFLVSDVAEFSSIYAFRIYQFIMKNKDFGKAKINLEELRYMLMLLDKYPATKDLRINVIDVATKEINEKSPYNISYEMIKKGRKFVAVEFKFKLKDTASNAKEKTARDPTTVDILYGLTDQELIIVRQKVADYIAHLESKGQSVSDFHRKNIENKAIDERWGLDEYYEQLQQVENERKELEQKQKEMQAKARAEKEQAERAEQRKNAMIAKFESLPYDEQEQILNKVGDHVGGFFASSYKAARESGTAHKDVMFMSWFFKILEM